MHRKGEGKGVRWITSIYDDVSTDVDLRYWYAPTSKDWVSQWNIQEQLYPNLASGESASGL
jgi:hypothetical protein